MTQLGKNLWILDGRTVSFMNLPFTTRMVIVRLNNGDLWIHSPIELTSSVKDFVDELGRVTYLVAPNHLHHLFMSEWQKQYPNAYYYGTHEVAEKRPDLHFDVTLDKNFVAHWADEFDYVLFEGSPLMQEAVFFHKPSKTLIVTDLIENFSGDTFSSWQKVLARLAGVMAPSGKTPIDWRVSFTFHKDQARFAFRKILEWQPNIIVMAHGEIITDHAPAFLQKSFSWLD